MGNVACCNGADNRQEAMRVSASSARVVGAKKACLVGINYRKTRSESRGCINDVNNMQKVSVEQYGFNVDDILMINEDQAKENWPTKQRILEGMDWSYKGAKPGDLLVFHYSGHGSQYNGDKKTMPSDVICPLDCIDGPWPSTVITDSEIHQKLYDPLPKGCKAVCLFDCCHSATVANLTETMVVKEGPLTAKKKEMMVKRLQAQKDSVECQVRFYNEVNSGKLDVKKKSKAESYQLFEKHSFPKKTGQISNGGVDDGSGYSYLLNTKLAAFCTGSVEKVSAILAEKEQASKQVQSMKVGDGAKIYIGNLEQDLEDSYEKNNSRAVTTDREIRIRYSPQPDMDIEDDERSVKPVDRGSLGASKSEKYKDHQSWVFSGCQDDQTSADAHVEGIYQGAFTWALLKALKGDTWTADYRTLMVQLKGNLEEGRYKQVPALSTTHELYLDFCFCGKSKDSSFVIEG